MARGVLVVSGMELAGKRLNTCMIDEAYGHQVPGGTYPLDCRASDPEFVKMRGTPPAVRLAGEKLYSALVAHPPVRDFFAHAAAPTPAAAAATPVYPLYVRVDTPDAEEFPWETLCETQKSFMVLDPQGRWPIARLAASGRAQPLDRSISSELRMAVVLAAAGESGADEWRYIAQAINGFNTPVDVLSLVSDRSTQSAIEADVAAWQGQAPTRHATVDFVGDDTSVMDRLKAQLPNVIHFFCHGNADVRPILELETLGDRKARLRRGSVTLGGGALEELGRLKSLWLVVLNCCQGAKAAPHLHSLAKQLVAAGVPAVVAMRESVDVSDANLFSEHFYPHLFAQLQAVFTVRNAQPASAKLPFQEVVWVRAVHEARRRLSSERGRSPDSSAQWTLPIVYVHRDELFLHPRQLKPAFELSPAARLEKVTQLDLLRQIRATMDPVVDDDAKLQRSQLDQQIQQIEDELSGM